MDELPELSLAEWIVLALIDEAPKHGFAVAALTGAQGEVGQVWQVARPIVYRSAARLTELALIRVDATERGGRGPQRSVLAATDAGAAAVRNWLAQPVSHIREVRSELLIKLALLSRRGQLSGKLLDRQRGQFEPVERALTARQRDASGFDRVLASWRTENVRAVLRFLDDAAAHQPSPDGPAPA